MTATSAIWGVWTNSKDIAYVARESPNDTKILDDHIHNIPIRGQSLADIGRLKKSELKPFGRGDLKEAFNRILNSLYANANITRRERLGGEMIKNHFFKNYKMKRCILIVQRNSEQKLARLRVK